MVETNERSAETFPRLMLQHAVTRPHRPAFREKDLGIWQTITWAKAEDEIRRFACGLAALALIWEHRLVVEPDVERINRAFFQINAVVSILLFGGVVWEFVHLGA